MGEPISEGMIHEGGAPPPGPEAPDAFEGLDGSTVEKTKPVVRPRNARRTPSEPDGPPAAASASPEPPAPAEAPARRGQRPGESEQEFFDRQAREQTARAIRAEENASIAREQGMQAASEIQRLNSMLEPLLRREWERAQLEERRQQMAAIPDPEQEPEAHNRYLLEQNIRLTLEERQTREAERQAAAEWHEQQEAERQRVEALNHVDGGWGQEMQSLPADPEAEKAYQTFLYGSVNALRSTYPNATEEQIQELAWGSNVILNRELFHNGIRMADYYKHQVSMMRQAIQLYDTGFNGSAPAQPQAATAAGAQPPTVRPGSPTAARVAAEAQRARQAQAVSAGGSPGRAGGMPGESLNPALFETDDDYVNAALQGEFNTENFIRTLGRSRVKR